MCETSISYPVYLSLSFNFWMELNVLAATELVHLAVNSSCNKHRGHVWVVQKAYKTLLAPFPLFGIMTNRSNCCLVVVILNYSKVTLFILLTTLTKPMLQIVYLFFFYCMEVVDERWDRVNTMALWWFEAKIILTFVVLMKYFWLSAVMFVVSINTFN